MSAPPPPPPRRARGPAGAPPPAAGGPSDVPPPPPRRHTPPDELSDALFPEAPSSAAATGTASVPPAGPTRAERRAAAEGAKGTSRRRTRDRSNGSSNGRGRRRLVIVGAIVVVLLLAAGGAFAAGVFSSDGGDEEAALEASTNVKLEPGEVKVRWPGLGPGQSDPQLPDEVMAVVGKYVDDGIVPGLRTGKVKTPALGETFDLGALAQLEGEARGTLLDEGLPKAIGKLTITAPPIDITALNDADNTTVLASAKVDLNIRVRSAKGYYTVRHDGELVFAPDPGGAWKITGWDVKAERTPPVPRPPWVTTTTSEKVEQQQ